MPYLPRKVRAAKKEAARKGKIAAISQDIAAKRDISSLAKGEARSWSGKCTGYIARPGNAKTTPKKSDPRQRLDEIRRHVGNQLASGLEFDF